MGIDWIECLDKRPTDRTGHDLVIIIDIYPSNIEQIQLY